MNTVWCEWPLPAGHGWLCVHRWPTLTVGHDGSTWVAQAALQRRTAAWPGGRRGRPCATRSAWSPSSTTWPSSMTMMRSALEHGGQAVGDDQGRAAGHRLVQRALDQPLVLGVERAGGLVEQQDRRVREPGRGRWRAAGAGRRTGSWPARRSGCRSPPAGHRGKSRPERPARRRASPASLAPGAAEADVVRTPSRRTAACPGPTRAMRARASRRVGAWQVDAVDPHRAGLGIVEAQQQAQHRALAGARRARPAPRARLDGRAAKSRSAPAGPGGRDRRRCTSSKPISPRAGVGQRRRVRRRRDRRPGVDHLGDSLQPRRTAFWIWPQTSDRSFSGVGGDDREDQRAGTGRPATVVWIDDHERSRIDRAAASMPPKIRRSSGRTSGRAR